MARRYNKYSGVKEVEIENYLVAQIKKLGGRCIKFDPRNSRGLHDRICFIPGGLLLLVEVKRPGAKPRINQIRQIAAFKKLGFQSTWCDTKAKVDSIILWIKKHRMQYKMRSVNQLCDRQDCPMRRK